MSMPTLCCYILIEKESQSVQGVNIYDILFAGMSNVWKRYLFANPVTNSLCLATFATYSNAMNKGKAAKLKLFIAIRESMDITLLRIKFVWHL